MTTTPYSFLTAKELSAAIAVMEDPTDFEIEAMQHIDQLLDEIEDLESALFKEKTRGCSGSHP